MADKAEVQIALDTAKTTIFDTLPIEDGVTVSITRKGKSLFLNVLYPVNADIANESITLDEPYDLESFNEKVSNLADSVGRSAALITAKLEAEAIKE